MNITFALYGNFADKGHGKGIESYYCTHEAWSKGYLKAIIAKDRVRSDISDEVIRYPLPLKNLLPNILKGIEYYCYPRLPSRYLSEELFDRFASKQIPACDIFHVYGAGMPRSCAVAKKQGALTIVHGTTASGNYNTAILRKEAALGGLPYTPFLGRMVDEAFCRDVDYVFAVSDFVKTTYVAAGFPAERIKVFPLGVDSRRFRPRQKSDDVFRCLFIGHMSLIKGVRYLLEAWERLDLAHAELVLAGTISPQVRAMIKEYQRKMPNIITPGKVDPTDHYARASLFILPSISEGCPKVVLEAMSCGLPVLVTLPAQAIARDGVDGYVVPIRDSGALAKKIDFFYRHPDKDEKMGAAARTRSENYSWERFSFSTARCYEEIFNTCYRI